MTEVRGLFRGKNEVVLIRSTVLLSSPCNVVLAIVRDLDGNAVEVTRSDMISMQSSEALCC